MSLCKHLYIILSLIFLASCSNSNTKDSGDLEKVEGETKPVEVSVRTLHKTNFNKQLISNGKIIANQQSTLRFQKSGILQHLIIKNGMNVHLGDTLAVLENAQEILNVEKAKIATERAKADILDHLIMAGYQNLKDTIHLSKDAYDYFKTVTGYKRALLDLSQASLNFNQSYLIAPFDGVISNLEKQQFDLINGANDFCEIYNPNKLAVSWKMLEMEISNIALGQRIVFSPFNDPLKTYSAIVSEINPNVDKHGLVKFKANNTDSQQNELLTGLNVKTYIEYSIPDQWVIPKEALMLRSNRAVVFNYQDGLAKWVYVTILHENESEFAIMAASSAPLFDNMQIIVSNNLNLAHDARVEIIKN